LTYNSVFSLTTFFAGTHDGTSTTKSRSHHCHAGGVCQWRQGGAEREQIRRMAESLAGDTPGLDIARLYQDALLKRLSLADAAAALTAHDHKLLAYEMAVCVCDADGVQSAPEQAYLAELKNALGLSNSEALETTRQADAIAELVDAPPTATKTIPNLSPSVITTAGVAAGGALVAAAASAGKTAEWTCPDSTDSLEVLDLLGIFNRIDLSVAVN
jgi:hypothetical protein